MALFGFVLTHHTRTNGAPRASQQAAYILRRERDYNREVSAYGWQTRKLRDTYAEDLTYATWGHLPAWAGNNPITFFAAADQYERANGRIASSLILTLPRDLTHTQHIALMEDWVTLQYPRHPYVVAMHTTTALDGLPYPHAHLTYSIRQTDGIERGPAQHFARWNAQHPDRGGAQKDLAFDPFGLMRAQRHTWADLVNWHVTQAGYTSVIDPRALHTREVPRSPTPTIATYHALQAKYDGKVSPVFQRMLDIRAQNQRTAPLEAALAQDWWVHRQTLLGLEGVSHTTMLDVLRANQGLETRQFAHPGLATAFPTAMDVQRGAIKQELHAQGTQRVLGKPLTPQMVANVARLTLQTTHLLRTLSRERDVAYQDQGFGR